MIWPPSSPTHPPFLSICIHSVHDALFVTPSHPFRRRVVFWAQISHRRGVVSRGTSVLAWRLATSATKVRPVEWLPLILIPSKTLRKFSAFPHRLPSLPLSLPPSINLQPRPPETTCHQSIHLLGTCLELFRIFVALRNLLQDIWNTQDLLKAKGSDSTRRIALRFLLAVIRGSPLFPFILLACCILGVSTKSKALRVLSVTQLQ